MILYTIMPAEIVFHHQQESQTFPYIEMQYRGVPLLASQVNKDEYRIERLLCTSLKEYLKPELQPGRIIKMQAAYLSPE